MILLFSSFIVLWKRYIFWIELLRQFRLGQINADFNFSRNFFFLNSQSEMRSVFTFKLQKKNLRTAHYFFFPLNLWFFLNHNRIEMGSTFVNIDIIHIVLHPSCWKFPLLIKERNINHMKYFLDFLLCYDLQRWKTNLHVWYKNGRGLLSFKKYAKRKM